VNLDSTILLWLNHFAGWSGSLDALVYVISDNPLAQAAVPVTILWFLWFRDAQPSRARRARELIISTVLGAAAGILLARVLALLLPFRTRPMATPGLGYHVMNPAWDKGLYTWSSFPSDHAVLFFALATGITVISRRLGIAVLAYAALIDGLPRVYLGYHYPSDIAAGALLGSVLAYAATRRCVRAAVSARILDWGEAHGGLFHAAMFVCTLEMANMFDSALQLARIFALLLESAVEHGLTSIAHGTPAIVAAALVLVGLGAVWVIAAQRRALAARPIGGAQPSAQQPDAGAAEGALEPAEDEPARGGAVPLDLAGAVGFDARQGWWQPQLLEFTRDAIIIWEMDGAGILYWNAAAEELYGYTREEAYGQVTHALLDTQLTGGRAGADLETVLARFGVWVGELSHVTKSGRRLEVEGRLALMSQRNGRWLVLEVNRDVTDRKTAQAARQAAELQLASLRGAMPDAG
jgi:undecaprenyl-diphosphatase